MDRGTRFRYTYYYPEPAPSKIQGLSLTQSIQPSASHPIHESISKLDHEAMDTLALPPGSATEAHTSFSAYLDATANTICGRHPIGVLLGALTELEETHNKKAQLQWVKYEQSSACLTVRDSSVSYASAWVTI
jgi:MEMO1 family protein